LLDRDPITHSALIAKVMARGGSLGEMWGQFNSGRLREVVHVAGNLVPAGGDPQSAQLLGQRLAGGPRKSVSIVGSAGEVAALWGELHDAWGPAREERLDQPLLVAQAQTTVTRDPAVRLARVEEADDLFMPTVSMFTEEVGVSPLIGTSEAAYRARLMWLIRSGRVLCRYDAHGVVFKAELAAITPHTCQVQGVWVRPDARGRGIGSAAMAALVPIALRSAPTVSLYVNSFNTAALTAYHRAGFRQVGTMASVHF
jgi:uncharacterized protein